MDGSAEGTSRTDGGGLAEVGCLENWARVGGPPHPPPRYQLNSYSRHLHERSIRSSLESPDQFRPPHNSTEDALEVECLHQRTDTTSRLLINTLRSSTPDRKRVPHPF